MHRGGHYFNFIAAAVAEVRAAVMVLGVRVGLTTTPFSGLDVKRHHQSVYTISQSKQAWRRECLFHGSNFNVKCPPCLDYAFIGSRFSFKSRY